MSDSGYGQLGPPDLSSAYNRQVFVINQVLARVRTMVLVRVVAFSAGDGDPAIPGTVTVQPIVNMTDGNGNATPHGQINNVPVWRLQGGGNAVIVDPAVDDVGWMAVADRDISAAKANAGAVSPPGSNRTFDLADGVYIGGLFGAAPTQWVRFAAAGIDIADSHGNKIVTTSTGIAFTGPVTFNDAATFETTVDVKGATTLEHTVDAKGAVTMESTLDVKGNALLEGTLDVKGLATLEGGVASIPGTLTAGAVHATGAIVANFGMGTSVGLLTHVHGQPNDGHGDNEFPTFAPTAGS